MIRIGYFRNGSAITLSIGHLLSKMKDIEVAFETANFNELGYYIERLPVEALVVLDNNEEFIDAIRDTYPALKIIHLREMKILRKTLNTGGVFDLEIDLHEVMPEEVSNAIVKAIGNSPALGGWSSVMTDRHSIPFDPRKLLTPREREIIEFLRMVENSTMKAANRFNIEVDSVQKFVNLALHKTGCHKRRELFDKIEDYESKSR